MRKAILILGLLALTNCAYKPKINPEASLHPHTGENLAGKYYYYLATCEDMWEKNAGFSVIKRQGSFTRKCMKDFGFKLLYW
jgi:hypothetical protein|tara:strand:+ start:319 stop:564 length:246 start_codon:yes stop_codon:yes gene_type:complete